MNLLEKIKNLKIPFRLPRSCVCCQTIVFFKLPLCRLCRSFLFKQYLKSIDQVYYLNELYVNDIPIYFLWVWNKENTHVIQRVIVALKDGANPKLYYLFANWMQSKLQRHYIFLNHDFCSVPSSNRKHPQKLIKVFASKFEGKELDFLIKINKKEQKTLTRSKRQKIAFKLKEYYRTTKPLVLLDDVVVTGGSVQSCVKTLRPSQVEYIIVWAKKPL